MRRPFVMASTRNTMAHCDAAGIDILTINEVSFAYKLTDFVGILVDRDTVSPRFEPKAVPKDRAT